MTTTTIELDRLRLGLICDLLHQHLTKMKSRRGETQRDFDFRQGQYIALAQEFEQAYTRLGNETMEP